MTFSRPSSATKIIPVIIPIIIITIISPIIGLVGFLLTESYRSRRAMLHTIPKNTFRTFVKHTYSFIIEKNANVNYYASCQIDIIVTNITKFNLSLFGVNTTIPTLKGEFAILNIRHESEGFIPDGSARIVRVNLYGEFDAKHVGNRVEIDIIDQFGNQQRIKGLKLIYPSRYQDQGLETPPKP